MQAGEPVTPQGDVPMALQRLRMGVRNNPDISDATKDKVDYLINHLYKHVWKGKYDLEQPASFPPMEIKWRRLHAYDGTIDGQTSKRRFYGS